MRFLNNPFMNAYKARLYPNFWDVIALLFALGIIALLAWDAKQMSAPYHLGQPITISLDPKHLPGYALRTVLRMLIALFFSLLFTFIFGTWAAKSKRAGRIIIPIIDICQSIPILGFLSVAIVGFISLFPNSLLGPECAAIFVIFTSQAWNMALGFYQTVRSRIQEQCEARRVPNGCRRRKAQCERCHGNHRPVSRYGDSNACFAGPSTKRRPNGCDGTLWQVPRNRKTRRASPSERNH